MTGPPKHCSRKTALCPRTGRCNSGRVADVMPFPDASAAMGVEEQKSGAEPRSKPRESEKISKLKRGIQALLHLGICHWVLGEAALACNEVSS